MELRALSHYDNDFDTRFGDCIMLFDSTVLVVYDCGHVKHAEAVEAFLSAHPQISEVNIVVSHNDSDHTDGVITLLDYLCAKTKITVTVYSSLYLKSARKVKDLLDDDRRTLPATKQHILDTFNNIKDIIEKAQECKFAVKNVDVGTKIASCYVVGPTEDEFVGVVSKAIKDNHVTQIEGETVMNAASVQLKCTLGETTVLLCGDATPEYLPDDLDSYDIFQLPHHGKLDNAKGIFDKLHDPYSKKYLVSDNTGSAETSGGSDDLTKYMETEHYTAAYNTHNSVVNLPKHVTKSAETPSQQGRAYYGDLGSV